MMLMNQLDHAFLLFYTNIEKRLLFSFILKMELSQTVRAKIVSIVQPGMTQSAVSRHLKTSRKNVSRTILRYNTTNSFASRARRGHPRTTSATTDRAIKRLVTSNPFVSSREVSSEVSRASRMSSRTVRRQLNGAHIEAQISKTCQETTSQPKDYPGQNEILSQVQTLDGQRLV